MEDNVKLEPGLASTMFRGLGLPRDMEKVPEDVQSSLIHASAYLVQVCLSLTLFQYFELIIFTSLSLFVVQAGQALLRAFSKAELSTVEKSRYHDDLKAEHDKSKTLRHNLKAAKARVVELEKKRDEAVGKAKNAERELGKMQRREKRKMNEVDGKAFQAGFDRRRVHSSS